MNDALDAWLRGFRHNLMSEDDDDYNDNVNIMIDTATMLSRSTAEDSSDIVLLECMCACFLIGAKLGIVKPENQRAANQIHLAKARQGKAKKADIVDEVIKKEGAKNIEAIVAVLDGKGMPRHASTVYKRIKHLKESGAL